MYNKEAILIPATSICEDVRGAIAFESTLELSSRHIFAGKAIIYSIKSSLKFYY